MDTCKLLRGVFLGLAAAQAVGVVHRDIKPANLLVEPSGLVKIVDFGLASVVRDRIDSTIYQSIVVGTPTYMAPEQAKDPDHCTWRVDAYAMGCVFYHCLVGHPPYQGGSAIETITMHAYHEVPLVSAAGIECPSKIVSLIADLMAKEPLSRPASYEEIIARIDRALSVRSSSFIRRLLPG
jgi:serine/threonine-protein kinase